jgi:hypothetical protein
MSDLRGLLGPRTRTRRGCEQGEPRQQSLHLHRAPLAVACRLDAAIVARLRDIARCRCTAGALPRPWPSLRRVHRARAVRAFLPALRASGSKPTPRLPPSLAPRAFAAASAAFVRSLIIGRPKTRNLAFTAEIERPVGSLIGKPRLPVINLPTSLALRRLKSDRLVGLGP